MAAHKHFPSLPSFQFAQKLLHACAGVGNKEAQGIVTSFHQWSAHGLWHLPSPRAGHSGHSSMSRPWQRWQPRDSPECAETQLTSQVRESWQRSVSCSASVNDFQKERCMTSSFPTCPWVVTLGHQPLAGKPLVGSSYVYLGDYCARIMKFAKLRLEFRCRKEQREDVAEPCWEWMVTPSTILVTCFGLLASLCSLGNCI